MASPELLKRWKATPRLLERARAAIPDFETAQPRLTPLQLQFTDYIEHNELELALDTLEETGDLLICRGGFWRDLERAAATMGMHKRAVRLNERFLSTARPSPRRNRSTNQAMQRITR